MDIGPNLKEVIESSDVIIAAVVFLVVVILSGCASTPKFEDGSRTSLYSTPCTTDSCGKLPEGF